MKYLRYTETDCKEYLIQAYAKSLMNYFATPLLASEFISSEIVEKWEQSIYRKMFLLPRDIKGSAITNLCRRSAPAKIVVSKAA